MSTLHHSITHKKPTWLNYVLHGISGLLTLAFLLGGATKLAGAEMHVENFARWGYATWFMYVTGFVEVLGAVLIAIPRTRFFGAALLVVTMTGAILTHIQSNEPAMIPVPFVLLVLAGFAGWMYRPFEK